MGYKRRLVYVDLDKQELSINGQKVISAAVDSSSLAVEYHGDFTDWDDFKKDSDVNSLKDKASNTLNKSGGGDKGTEKGVGKGLPRATQ